MQEPGERSRRSGTTESDGQVGLDTRQREEVERQLHAAVLQAEEAPHPVERPGVGDRLGSAVAAEQEKPRTLGALGEDRDQVDSAAVGPVQILQHEDERDLVGQLLHELREDPQHALGCGAGKTGSQIVEFSPLDEPGKLDEPGRCMLAQQPHDPRRMRPTCQTPDGFEHRHQRLFAAAPAHAPSRRNYGLARTGTAGNGGEERFDECRLADPGFSGDEHGLAGASGGRLEELM